MRYNDWTMMVAIATLVLYAFYAFGTMGLGGLLLISAIGLIVASFVNSIEYVAVCVVVLGLIYSSLFSRYHRCKESFTDGTPTEISRRIAKIAHRPEPVGVYDSRIEGFQDVQTTVATPEQKEGESSTSQPASSVRQNEVEIKNDISSAPTPAQEKKDVMKVSTETFNSSIPPTSNTAGLFKLGEMPTEMKDGPFVDAGSTLLKAMGALKPDQITSMTSDTQKLIETQKGLMNMLQSMRPVLQDGRQLLDSFSSIFGGSGGSGGLFGMK